MGSPRLVETREPQNPVVARTLRSHRICLRRSAPSACPWSRRRVFRGRLRRSRPWHRKTPHRRGHAAGRLRKTKTPESRVSLVNPSGGSCSRTDSLLGEDLFCPAPGRAALRRAPQGRGRAAHGPTTNGSTTCRMRSASPLRGRATKFSSPLRRHARVDAYRGPLGFAPLPLPRGSVSKIRFIT